MKILLIHPEDSPRRGPWARQEWDLIIDLGKSSEQTAAAWQALCRCPVLRLASFRTPVEDPRQAGNLLRAGFGQLLDSCGLDWWELTSLYVHAQLEAVLAMQRLAVTADVRGDLYCTRPGWPVDAFAKLLGKADLRSLSTSSPSNAVGRMQRFTHALSRLSMSQAFDVACDKYDADYRWRARFRRRPAKSLNAAVLVPSAYTNVSRAAAGYARLLPELNFLLVATRRSALMFDRVSNMTVSPLAGYASSHQRPQEYAELVHRWTQLREKLRHVREFELLISSGILEPLQDWIRSGLAVRDAWSKVLDSEPITAVLCGDDSNWHTRLPVVLARKRSLPTLDFHHGALDGRFLMKALSSDSYLAKTEMEWDYLTRVCRVPSERVLLGGGEVVKPIDRPNGAEHRPHILFFSEPYESSGGRPEEVYRELLPPLYRLAQEHARTLVVKLHPFENSRERQRLVEATLGTPPSAVKIVTGSLSPSLLESAWFGITVESSTVLDCTKSGVPCFHCPWFGLTPYGYGEQFARFGIGCVLSSPGDLAVIPRLLEEWPRRYKESKVGQTAEILRQVFSGRAMPTPALPHWGETE